MFSLQNVCRMTERTPIRELDTEGDDLRPTGSKAMLCNFIFQDFLLFRIIMKLDYEPVPRNIPSLGAR